MDAHRALGEVGRRKERLNKKETGGMEKEEEGRAIRELTEREGMIINQREAEEAESLQEEEMVVVETEEKEERRAIEEIGGATEEGTIYWL